jgi:hypothetical protein
MASMVPPMSAGWPGKPVKSWPPVPLPPDWRQGWHHWWRLELVVGFLQLFQLRCPFFSSHFP